MLAFAHKIVQYVPHRPPPHNSIMNTRTSPRIGIIQNAPLTADFPNNLRAIVQGYRECLDHGATLVIAPAYALCGPNPAGLAARRSFMKQTQAALHALSLELGDAPLLLGAHAPLFSEGEEEWDELFSGGCEDVSGCGSEPVPFLLERDSVTELADGEAFELGNLRVYVDISIGEGIPDDEGLDLLVHLNAGCWHATCARNEAENHLWEARNNDLPVVSVQGVGTADGRLYGGGSGIYLPNGNTLMRLPFFETANRVADLVGTPQARALPRADELMQQALSRGVRDTALNLGYRGVCLPLDHPNAPLLAAICADALGATKVQGVSFGGEAAMRVTKVLGIRREVLDAAPLLNAAGAEIGSGLAARLAATLITTFAEEHDLLLLSPLDKHAIALGEFTPYAEGCGQLMPLGELYPMDVHLLSLLMEERHPGLFGTLAEPATPEQDRIIHELADRNIGASDLLASQPGVFEENTVRRIQRRLITAAPKRGQLPPALRVDAPEERHVFPVHHRLND